MNEIKPTYVTFEQAKLLKEKNFNIDVKSYYTTSEEFTPKDYYYYGNEINYNSRINDINNINGTISRPEQWQVVEWLRVKHGIWISVYTMDKWLSNDNDRVQIFDYSIKQMKRGLIDISKKLEEFDSPKEAYSAAFDYILNNLI
jgi:hypothetical protein